MLQRGRQKGLKSEFPGGTMTHHGVHMEPQGCPGEARGSPKPSQKSSKIEVLGPGWPPGSPKAGPGSKKSPKLKENRCKTPARPRGKIRGSDAPQEAFPGALPQNPAEKNMLRLLWRLVSVHLPRARRSERSSSGLNSPSLAFGVWSVRRSRNHPWINKPPRGPSEISVATWLAPMQHR